MKYGFSLIMRGNEARPEAFEAMAEKAEALGFDSLWCSDHLIVPPLKTSRYPGRPDGKFPPIWLERYWEPFTVLSYVAARTRRSEQRCPYRWECPPAHPRSCRS